MLGWFLFSVASFVLLGTAIALYKLPAVKEQSKTATAFWTLLFSAILALLFFGSFLPRATNETLMIGALWGFGFAAICSLQMRTLEDVEINTLFPVTATLSLIVSVLIGLFFFADKLSAIQLGGVALAVAAVYLFLYKDRHSRYSPHVILLGAAILFFSVLNKVVLKVGADNVDIHSLQICQYLFAAAFALTFFALFNRPIELRRRLFSGSMKSGLIISIPSFLGGWALLIALTRGPFSLITSLHAMYIFVAALEGWFFFKERLTRRKMALLLLAITAIILIRVG